jgi:multidrug resistance efflux pump
MGFDESGTLIEVNVSRGDVVKADEVLARLQTKKSQAEINAAIAEAELIVAKAQDTIENLYENVMIERANALNDIARYADAVRDAQYQLENYTIPTNLVGMTAIEALDEKKAKLDSASAAFAPYKYLSETDKTREDLLDLLYEAQSEYDAAVKRLEYEYELQVAEANLDKARDRYAKVEKGPAADELKLAQAELANALARLELAKEDQAVLELVAPTDGILLAVEANMGEIISTTPILTLGDLDGPQIEINLDETDVARIAIGSPVTATIDAFPGAELAGEVIDIAPSATVQSGVVLYPVTVRLDSTDLSTGSGQALPVRPGMTANVTIIVEGKENTLIVPFRAIETEGGQAYVTRVTASGAERVAVTLGLITDTQVEILSGVNEGDVVTVYANPVQDTKLMQNPMFGGGQ